MADTTPLTFTGLSKRFGGVQALADVSFSVDLGTIHAVVGENGAGKTTLMNILAGVVRPDTGAVSIAGEPLPLGSPAESRAHGVEVVYQELSLFPDLTVAQNIHVGREPLNRLRLVDARRLEREAARALAALGSRISPSADVFRLSIAEQQLVEIARALSHRARIVVLDEPNSALTIAETAALFETLRRLRADGVTTLLVSHRLDEVFEIADAITVLRNGRHIATAPAHATTIEEVVERMVGRPPSRSEREQARVDGPPRLRVDGLTRGRKLVDVSFHVGVGEVVGLAGLEGCGANEVLESLFGIVRADGGTVTVDGHAVRVRTAADAVGKLFALVPRDRRTEGVLADLNVEDNLALCSLGELRRGPLVTRRKKGTLARKLVSELAIKIASPQQSILALSGGNQQKVVVGRWLATKPKVLLLNDPTRGVDVGAKAEIHALIARLAAEGISILMTSSEFEEIVEVADRALVFYRGRLVAEVPTDAPDAGDRIVALATTGVANGRPQAVEGASR
jgi:rhamnose transport system ATP-binding protein